MDNFFWMAMALIAGGVLPFLGAFNARLGVAIASPLYASMISFLVGTLVIASYLLIIRPNVAWAGASGAPWYAWLGVFCGAFSLSVRPITKQVRSMRCGGDPP